MSSHAQDSTTQKAATAGAQSNDATLDANAAQNQAYANQTRNALFGSYNPATNSYSGGSTSQFLNPSSLNQNGLSGTYLNQYNNASNTLANQTKNAVGTTMQDMANRGMGKSPAGFAADQERQAYQTQAGQQGNLYTGAAQQQHSDALNNYWNANNMLNSNASQTANLALQGNQAAAGNYASLYGTASQQAPSAWGTVLGAAAGLGEAALTGKPPAPGCWVAAELYGGWDDLRVSIVRGWIFGPFSESRLGRTVAALYARFGERVARMIKTNRPLRAIMQRLFDRALGCGMEALWQATR